MYVLDAIGCLEIAESSVQGEADQAWLFTQWRMNESRGAVDRMYLPVVLCQAIQPCIYSHARLRPFYDL